jgi:hypothetical protein
MLIFKGGKSARYSENFGKVLSLKWMNIAVLNIIE